MLFRSPAAKSVPASVNPAPKVVPVVAKAPAKPAKPEKTDFHNGDYVVYPTHGVGKIVSIEKQSIAGIDLDLIVIRFEKEKMTLRVPIEKAKVAG